VRLPPWQNPLPLAAPLRFGAGAGGQFAFDFGVPLTLALHVGGNGDRVQVVPALSLGLATFEGAAAHRPRPVLTRQRRQASA
jgi:hypothetical protein